MGKGRVQMSVDPRPLAPRDAAPGDGGGAPASPAAPAAATRLSALLSASSSVTIAAGLLSAALVIAALYLGREILLPLAIAFLLGFVLDPFVVRLRRLRVPRTLAVVIVVGASLALIALAGLTLARQVSVLSDELPTYQSNIHAKLRDFRERWGRPGMFDGVLRTLDTVQEEVQASAEAAGKGGGRAPPPRVQVVEPPPTPASRAMRWLEVVGGPLANAGIALVFLVFVLLDRQDLRDRLLRLLGGNLHRTTDAMDEAGERISRYLTMQLVVNASYGLPMALGLWLIGVPGAFLWGAIAAVMRFVPYVGPMISAVFPIALAFAVDPGWSMVLWTILLIALLELVSNNVVEPWLYGTSTGLSALSLLVAATFWTSLWGPIGLVMATPLTVCLLVIGRHLPHLQFLDVLLGSQPALDAPTRLYQRLLAGDTEEAVELATEMAEADSVTAFYNATAVPTLRLASVDHGSVATAEHRHRLVTGMEQVIDEMRTLQPPPPHAGYPKVVCIGGKWAVDTLAARMLAHALCLAGTPAEHRAAAVSTADLFEGLDLRGARIVCLSHFSPEPQTRVRYLCRRLRRRWPKLYIVLALWNAGPELLDEALCKSMGADAVAASIAEAVMRVGQHLHAQPGHEELAAPVPEKDAARVAALRASGLLDARHRAEFDLAATRTADIFDVPLAMVSLVDDDTQHVAGLGGPLAAAMVQQAQSDGGSGPDLPRPASLCAHVVGEGQTVVVEDIARDPRFADNPALLARHLRFYAGAPLADEKGFVLGTLCLLGDAPRTLDERERKLLESMAGELMQAVGRGQTAGLPAAPSNDAGDDAADAASSATVAQQVP